VTDSEVKKKARRGPTLSIVAALYLLFAIASSWPLATQLGDALPQGTDRAATVPLFHAWSLWWTADRMADGLTGFWTAPIFTPTPDSFLFSDPLILLGMLAAPLLWMGASPVLAHNLLLLLAVTGNGLFTFGLLRCLDIRRGPAALGGLMLLMLPYVHHELGVLMLVPLGGLLGFMWALIQFAKTPGPVPALLMGAAAAATYLMCGQYGIMLALVIAPASLCLVDRRWLAARAMGSLAAGGLLCALLIAPLILKQIETIDAHGFGRSESAAMKSASHPTAWTLTPWSQLVPAPGIEMASEVWMQAHFPGTLKLLLALTGIVIGLRDPRLRRWTAFLLTATVLASLFSTLPRLEFGDTSPYRALRDVIPGLSTMRSFWRFIVVAQIGVVLLAVLSLEFMRARSQARTGEKRGIALAIPVLGLLAAVELWPSAQKLAPAPDFEHWQPWTSWVTENVPDSGLVHLPFPSSAGVADFEDTARWMLLASAHGRPLANGYSGFFPRRYNMLTRALRGCPTPAGYKFVRFLGYDSLAIRRSWLEAHPGCGPPTATWERVETFDDLDVEMHRALSMEIELETRQPPEG